MDAGAAHEKLVPRWPVYVRFGHHDEVLVGDMYAEDTPAMLTAMAGLLRSVADHLEGAAERS